MKRLLVSLLALVLTLSLAGVASANTPVKIGASITPHAEVLTFVKDALAEKGFDLDVVEIPDYVIPNTATEDGELDANFFQNLNYLNWFNDEYGTRLVAAISMHFEPMGVYPGSEGGKSRTSLADLQDGDKIAVGNDTTNQARALLLLQAQGLIKLAEGVGVEATKLDIVEYAVNFELIEMDAPQIPLRLADVAFGVINGNYALQHGLNVTKDSVASEAADTIDPGYINYVVVKEGNEDAPFVQALREILNSDDVRAFYEETYPGASVPAF